MLRAVLQSCGWWVAPRGPAKLWVVGCSARSIKLSDAGSARTAHSRVLYLRCFAVHSYTTAFAVLGPVSGNAATRSFTRLLERHRSNLYRLRGAGKRHRSNLYRPRGAGKRHRSNLYRLRGAGKRHRSNLYRPRGAGKRYGTVFAGPRGVECHRKVMQDSTVTERNH